MYKQQLEQVREFEAAYRAVQTLGVQRISELIGEDVYWIETWINSDTEYCPKMRLLGEAFLAVEESMSEERLAVMPVLGAIVALVVSVVSVFTAVNWYG